ncbi:predicted protein [Sclerotinia sclerotiorum 1980 UF-70]|uniref:Uncharacterized protein n=1 Tax=Sclerotinia sclerotiorum (strain ATCC 18683 / 1980 / Ss-1) TaxID=665079 RepID=A7EIM7_SCLS1|nr:predicted protein [Sclerotinia sclerotiorum 1980 UF-70]EDO02693.1 predicted protein [Sclerotinia sclerotiorum 1980 UF-70]
MSYEELNLYMGVGILKAGAAVKVDSLVFVILHFTSLSDAGISSYWNFSGIEVTPSKLIPKYTALRKWAG